ncbi:MAG: glycosyltransferase [Oscillatoriales cyanobacterium SM2_2_1]|nr:glycosyltransferase [Oscillatoriales cyanobacterium SM2_2_1]
MAPRLLYFCSATRGGIADYAHAQATAIARSGIEVIFLTSPSYRPQDSVMYIVDTSLPEMKDWPLPSKILLAVKIWEEQQVLHRAIILYQTQNVLFATYSEYLAPLWCKHLESLSRQQVCFGAVVHDPCRTYQVGPRWWHRWSIACGYRFLQEAFVHEAIALDTVEPMPHLTTTVIPHGTYQFPPAQKARDEVRECFEIPKSATLLLAFGQIRDNKNLDLAMRAIAQFPELHLLIAGRVVSQTQKPVSYYQALAEELGISHRCHWLLKHVPNHEIGDLFQASDVVLLTYRSDFSSASGVLNLAVAYRRPCLASAGASNLRTVVQNYNLGIFVEPDSWQSVRDGIQAFLGSPPEPKWALYEAEQSWERNAELVCSRMFRAHHES